MLDIGVPELLIILAIILVIFGPGRLVGMGKALGETIHGFRHAMRDESEQPTSEHTQSR